METITIPKTQFERMVKENRKLKQEVEVLRKTQLYQRLVEYFKNIKIKKYTRDDLGI